ncbi:MAG: hypothetical protein ACHQQ3_04390 [Gemmatimonadales bacterium]
MLLHAAAVAGALAVACPDSLTGPSGPRVALALSSCASADTTLPKKRVKALQLSDAYETRLSVHKWASYATVPLFAAQAVVGQQLYTTEMAGNRPSQGTRFTHDVLAAGVGALFAVNTVTGSLNWWETRSQTEGRTWRTIHAALMLASDAGFAYTAALGHNARHLQADRNLHKNMATVSASIALVSYVMMLSPIRRD